MYALSSLEGRRSQLGSSSFLTLGWFPRLEPTRQPIRYALAFPPLPPLPPLLLLLLLPLLQLQLQPPQPPPIPLPLQLRKLHLQGRTSCLLNHSRGRN